MQATSAVRSSMVKPPSSMADQLRAARKLLSDTQLIAFFRAAGTEDHPRAPGIICRQLDRGLTLEAIFRPPPRPGLITAVLKVVRLSPRTFHIKCGFNGAHVGDGGEWRVVFTASGTV